MQAFYSDILVKKLLYQTT